MTSTKQCSRCQRTKPLTDFGKDARRADGLRSSCKMCRASMRKRARAGNPEQRDAERARYLAKADEIRERRIRRYWDARGGLDVERLARIHALAAEGMTNKDMAACIRPTD